MTPQITRIAPSPTGYLHVGTARTAYHNWLVARATGGKFILRIDDTDAARNDDKYTDLILDCLNWLGLDWDALIKQSDRLNTYKNYVGYLVSNKLAYTADNGAVLLSRPTDMPDYWVDTVAGRIPVRQDDIDSINDMVLVKGDGNPTYNFCSIIDDIDMGVTNVIRGVDHIKNTPKQIAIMLALDVNPDSIQFTHVGLIHDMKTNKKISKRDGAKGVTDYQADGILPDALLNLLLRMGWSPSLKNFDSVYKTVDKDVAKGLILTAGHFNSSSSKFDVDKLNYYNKQYKKLVNAIR